MTMNVSTFGFLRCYVSFHFCWCQLIMMIHDDSICIYVDFVWYYLESHTHTGIHIDTRVRVCTWTHTDTYYIHTHTHVLVHLHICKCRYMCILIYIYMHVYIIPCTWTCTAKHSHIILWFRLQPPAYAMGIPPPTNGGGWRRWYF